MNGIRINYITPIAIILSSLAIGSYFFFGFDEKALLGILGTLVTIYFGLLKIKIEHDRFFMELFTDFNAKYDNRINDFLNELRNKPRRKLKVEDKKLLYDYFNLCAEEYLWWKEGRISPAVWKAWKAGIQSNLEIPQVKELFNEEAKDKKTRKSYYGFIEELDKN